MPVLAPHENFLDSPHVCDKLSGLIGGQMPDHGVYYLPEASKRGASVDMKSSAHPVPTGLKTLHNRGSISYSIFTNSKIHEEKANGL